MLLLFIIVSFTVHRNNLYFYLFVLFHFLLLSSATAITVTVIVAILSSISSAPVFANSTVVLIFAHAEFVDTFFLQFFLVFTVHFA